MAATSAWALRDRGTGPSLLLLHGFTGSGAAWADHEEAFGQGRRLLIPDLPGHGATVAAAPADASVERSAEVLYEMLGVRDPAPADVVAYSLGARIALRLAVEHPDRIRRLVLESPSAGIESPEAREERRTADEALARRIERDGLEAFVDEWARLPLFAATEPLPPDRAAKVRAMRLANTSSGLVTSLRGAGQGAMEPLFDRLGAVTAPTLVIAGSVDVTGLDRARRVAAGIPLARLAIVSGAGHTPHDDAPETFRRLVLEFLQEDLPT